MTVARSYWRGQILARVGCVLCTRGWGGGYGKVDNHHVATGSSKRHPDALARLCEGHHTGPAGLHGTWGGRGTKGFIALYKPPDMHELGLIVWTIEDATGVVYELQKRKKTPPTPREG